MKGPKPRDAQVMRTPTRAILQNSLVPRNSIRHRRSVLFDLGACGQAKPRRATPLNRTLLITNTQVDVPEATRTVIRSRYAAQLSRHALRRRGRLSDEDDR